MLISTSAPDVDTKTGNKWAEYAGNQSHLGNLPDGWETALAPSGEVYFVNHHTKSTTWIDPRTKVLRYPTVLECQPGDLPYGWEEITLTPGPTSTRLTVFANHIKRKLTLNDPTRTNARQLQYLDKRNLALVEDPTAATILKHQIKTYWMDQVRAIEEEYHRGMRTEQEELEEGEVVLASPTVSSRSVSPGPRSPSPVHKSIQAIRETEQRGGSPHHSVSPERNMLEKRQASRAIGVQTVSAAGVQQGPHYIVAGRSSPQSQPSSTPQVEMSRGRHASKGSRSRPSSPQRFTAPVRQHSDDKVGRVRTAGV